MNNPVVPNYEQRVVVVLDILGFTELTMRSAVDSTTFQQIFRILSLAGNSAPQWNDPSVAGELWESVGRKSLSSRKTHDDVLKILASRDRAFAFSDTVVLSSPLDWSGCISTICSAIRFCLALLERGFLVRGGIATGMFFHSDNLVFGPALIDAHRLESHDAHYPRVVLTAETFRDIIALKKPYDLPFELAQFFFEQSDNLYALHVLGRAAREAIVGSSKRDEMFRTIHKVFASRIPRLIQLELKARMKNLWTLHYLNRVIAEEPTLGVKAFDCLPDLQQCE